MERARDNAIGKHFGGAMEKGARGWKVWAVCASLVAISAHAFKLQAWEAAPGAPSIVTPDRQARAFMQQFRVDVHERITRRAYERAGVALPAAVLAGIRWNDNPPSLRANPLFGGCLGRPAPVADGMACWARILRLDSVALAALTQREKSLAPLRSHFGDMQFLHAMAGRSGESAEETRRNILRWSEFAYRVALGEIAPGSKVSALGRGESALDPDTAQWIGNLFRGPSVRHQTVEDLFLPRSSSVRLVAFGSLLHLVEDSYSAAHVRRHSARVQGNGCLSYDADDAVAQFQTYVGQDTEKHGVCDDAPDWLDTERAESPIGAIAEVVTAYEAGREWPVVRAILEERIFRLLDSVLAAQPGACFEWRLTESNANAKAEAVTVVKCD